MELIFRVIIIGSLIIFSGCSRDKKQPGYEIFPDMVHSVAFEAFSENPLTKDGKTMMLPPERSIARGYMPFSYGKGDEEAERAGRELKNPLLASDKVLARGKHGYDNYCLICHGPEGQGDGPLIPKFPNPPSLTNKGIKAYADGRLYHVITKGYGDMPSHEVQLRDKDRWAVVHYIRYIQQNFGRK